VFPQKLQKNEEYDLSLQFFEDLLRHDSDCRLTSEYPLAFDPKNLDYIFVSRTGLETQAGLVSLEREIELSPGQTGRALFIGSVVTAPEHRSKGLQRQLFHAVEEEAEKNGIDFLCLWSNQLEFYEKIGFSLGGLQASWTAEHRFPLSQTKLGRVELVDSGQTDLTEKHFHAFDKKRCRVKRTFEEMQKLWHIPRMRIAFTENAYAIMGKGEDFTKVCHEWAGPAAEVLSCLDVLREKEPELKILSPGVLHDADEAEVVSQFESSSFESRLEYLGLFRVLSSKVNEKGFSPEDLQYPFFIWGLDSI